MRAAIVVENIELTTRNWAAYELAICSQIFVQVGNGIELVQKMVFCRVRQNKCRAKCETFFLSNPVKKLFSD